jgi:hypothetical protein
MYSDVSWAGGTDGFSFELKQNGAYVLESPSWGRLPPECATPLTPTGDIVCIKSVTIQQGDRLTPTWFEPSHQSSVGDNDGTIFIDLYGFIEVLLPVTARRHPLLHRDTISKTVTHPSRNPC